MKIVTRTPLSWKDRAALMILIVLTILFAFGGNQKKKFFYLRSDVERAMKAREVKA